MQHLPFDPAPTEAQRAARAAARQGLALRTAMAERILPFWASQGFDAALGLFHERMDDAGRPDAAAPRRAMVQARQIYVFSHAARAGLLPQGGAPAEAALHGLMTRYAEDGGAGGFAFALHPDGRVQAAARDSYAHAFVLFALAAAYRLTGDRLIRRCAERTLGFVDRFLWDAGHGGLRDRYPDPAAGKAQNPLMHYLEALLALHEAFPDGPYLERARAVLALFEARILRRRHGVVPEIFAADWSDHPDAARSAFFEPGHHCEWIWLLDWAARLGLEARPDVVQLLWRTALDHGRNAEGWFYDEVGFDGLPRKPSLRLWPHAEAAKAGAILGAGEGESAEASGVAAAALRVLNEDFLGRPFAAGWTDRLAPDKCPLPGPVPASSLYHAYGALVETERLLVPLRGVEGGGL